MDPDIRTANLGSIRGTDSNSLLRLYDQARAISDRAASRHERDRAERTIRRLAKELQKRKVPL